MLPIPTKVLIFGSGGSCKEILGYIADDFRYEVVGIVSTEPFNNPAFAKFRVYEKTPDIDAGYIMGVADPDLKRKFVSENADRWITYAHKSCHISPYAKIGKGCWLAAYSSICGDAVIGDFVSYNVYAQSGHDCVIGDYTTFSPYAETCGGCIVGDGVFFGVRAVAVPKVNIAAGAKISAGAVVRKSILEAVTVYGDPARPRAAV